MQIASVEQRLEGARALEGAHGGNVWAKMIMKSIGAESGQRQQREGGEAQRQGQGQQGRGE